MYVPVAGICCEINVHTRESSEYLIKQPIFNAFDGYFIRASTEYSIRILLRPNSRPNNTAKSRQNTIKQEFG